MMGLIKKQRSITIVGPNPKRSLRNCSGAVRKEENTLKQSKLSMSRKYWKLRVEFQGKLESSGHLKAVLIKMNQSLTLTLLLKYPLKARKALTKRSKAKLNL